jgi:hypothetical protein
MGIRSFLLLITAAVIIFLLLGIWFSPSNVDFQEDNVYWNGINDLVSQYNIQPLDSLADLPLLPYEMTVIVIPYLDFNTKELEQISSFINQGGRLVLADDYGYGNHVLEYLRLSPRFSGEVMLDPLVNYVNQHFPRITRLLPDTLTTNTDNLVFNHATCLEYVDSKDVIALSSSFSFLDKNDSGIREETESSGPFPTISRHQIGNGQVILISDPSIFINSMYKIEGNIQFIQNIAATTDAIYIDQSHLGLSELNQAKNWLKTVRRFFFTPIVTAILAIIAVTASLIPVWYKKKEITV